MDVFWWILFSVNFILYGSTCFMIFKRKKFTSVSVRSPVLLIVSIVGNFFVCQILILFRLFDSNDISSFYFFFRLMMIIPLVLRYERILRCCNIYKNNEKEDEKYLAKKRYLFQEKFYFKIMMIILLSLAIVLIVLYFIDMEDVEILLRFNLIYDFEDKDEEYHKTIYKMNVLVWVCWNFLEQIVIILYLFRIVTNHLKEKIKVEIALSSLVWYIYQFICSVLSLYLKEDSIDKNSDLNLLLIVFSLIFHYSLLFINGIFPIILSFNYRTSLSYHFNPHLIGNLFLFLTNEDCYDTFYEYLKKIPDDKDKKGLFYLKLYTHIMKYKLNFTVNIDNQVEAANDLNDIYRIYFSHDNFSGNYIDTSIVTKIRTQFEGLHDRILPEIFDKALQFCFSKLGAFFDEFRKNKEYKRLYKRMKEYSYIHCKMCNTGLINQL